MQLHRGMKKNVVLSNGQKESEENYASRPLDGPSSMVGSYKMMPTCLQTTPVRLGHAAPPAEISRE